MDPVASRMPTSTSGSPTALISQSNTPTRRVGLRGVEHDVVELVVAVNERGAFDGSAGMRASSHAASALHLRNVAGLRAVPALRPAADLPRDETGGLAEGVETVRDDVDRVQVGERVDDAAADARTQLDVAGDRRRLVGADDDAAAPLHHIEDGADDARVLAEQIRLRRERKVRMHRGQHATTRAPCRARAAAPVRTADGAAPSRDRRSGGRR